MSLDTVGQHCTCQCRRRRCLNRSPSLQPSLQCLKQSRRSSTSPARANARTVRTHCVGEAEHTWHWIPLPPAFTHTHTHSLTHTHSHTHSHTHTLTHTHTHTHTSSQLKKGELSLLLFSWTSCCCSVSCFALSSWLSSSLIGSADSSFPNEENMVVSVWVVWLKGN